MSPARRTSFYFGLWFIGTFVFSEGVRLPV